MIETSENSDATEKQEAASADMGNGKRVTKDGADMQSADKSIPTRNLSLPYQEEEVHYGWLNDDIHYVVDAPKWVQEYTGARMIRLEAAEPYPEDCDACAERAETNISAE